MPLWSQIPCDPKYIQPLKTILGCVFTIKWDEMICSCLKVNSPDFSRVFCNQHIRLTAGYRIDGQLYRRNHKALADRQPKALTETVGWPAVWLTSTQREIHVRWISMSTLHTVHHSHTVHNKEQSRFIPVHNNKAWLEEKWMNCPHLVFSVCLLSLTSVTYW